MSIPTTTLSGTSQWSDYSNSDPISDIMGVMNRNIKNSSSEYWEFRLMMSRKTHAQIWMHPDIQITLLKYPDTHYFYEMFKNIIFIQSFKYGIVVISKNNQDGLHEVVESIQVL